MSTQSLPSRAAVVIIGGGMAGLSCASSLAQQGVNDVVLLEAKTLAHAGASSFGESRMFREMYSDPVLCRLAQEANRLWREEEQRSGEILRQTHGLLFYGESWDEETIEGSIPGARRVMDDQGIPYEALTAHQIQDPVVFPAIAHPHFQARQIRPKIPRMDPLHMTIPMMLQQSPSARIHQKETRIAAGNPNLGTVALISVQLPKCGVVDVPGPS